MTVDTGVGQQAESRLPAIRPLLQVTALIAVLAFGTRELNLNSWNSGGNTILWPTNGLLLGVLLCNQKRYWPTYIAVAFSIDLLVNVSLHDPLAICLYLSSCNMFECYLAAVLLVPYLGEHPDLTQKKQFAAFFGYGILCAPALASFAASFVQNGRFRVPRLDDTHEWLIADGLGIAIVTPLCLAFHQRDPAERHSWLETAGLFLLLTAVTFAVFWQTRFPFLFVILPFLLFLGIKRGLTGSAAGLLVVAVIGGFLSTAGHGPVGLVAGREAERDLVFQFFIATAMLLAYVIEVLSAESMRLQADLKASERRFRLLAEASNDIIFLNDLVGRRSYVSPSVIDILGWHPEQLMEQTFRDLVHPDDNESLRNMFERYRENRIAPAPEEFRYLNANGTYTWLEFNLRLHYDERGEPAGFVNVARDISRRKKEEEEFQRDYDTVEQLASSDALTGIANRRHFDAVFEKEWLRAAREQTHLSMLLIDVDRFKPYNDVYGHLTGDECLRAVAAAIKPCVSRPADLLARYGGEEFVVILPNTDSLGARQMAEWIRGAVEMKQLPHPGNPPHGVITLSIGCATLIPQLETKPTHLFESADRALYEAKSSGRNRVEIAAMHPDAGSVLLTG